MAHCGAGIIQGAAVEREGKATKTFSEFKFLDCGKVSRMRVIVWMDGCMYGYAFSELCKSLISDTDGGRTYNV